MNVYRFQCNKIDYWKMGEQRNTEGFNHHFGFYVRQDVPFRSMLEDIIKFRELNVEDYSIAEIVQRILTNDYYYFVNLYDRVKKHEIYNHPKRTPFIDKEFGQIVRELCLEDYRLKNHPEYPSRHKCLFCIPTEEGIEFWREKLFHGAEDYQLVELFIEGKTFIGTNNYLANYVQDIDSYYKYVSQYWEKPVTRPTKESEILIEGHIRCIQIICQGNVGTGSHSDEMTVRE